VSLFASSGQNGSVYITCQADANPDPASSCNLNAPYQDFQGVGGTSAPTPAFAGIIALVNQKTGQRQGNANYVLYPLAAQNGSSCTSNAAARCTSSRALRCGHGHTGGLPSRFAQLQQYLEPRLWRPGESQPHFFTGLDNYRRL
jgi:subtilisin family serine protease